MRGLETYGRRPTRDQLMMSHALLVSHRSTCVRLQVGAVIAMDARIISTGYNGTPPGMPHCDHTCRCVTPAIRGHVMGCAGVDAPCEKAVHAETNAIAFAARYGVSTAGGQLYVTNSPCLKCAQLIISAGITRLSYAMAYRIRDGIDLLKAANVEVSTI